MDEKAAGIALENALKGFHGKFKKMYGQLALRIDDNSYITTGGNKSLSDITPDHFEICDIGSGDLGEIFRSRPHLTAVIFGCSPDTVKASDRDSDIAVSLEDAAMISGPTLRIIPDASPASILSVLDDSGVCLIRGTGLIAMCSNLKKAVAAVQIAEKACEAENHGNLIGGTVPLSPEAAESCRRNFLDDYTNRNEETHVEFVGFNEEEFSLRSELIEYGKDLIRHDLSYGSWGNLSVRLNKDEMLITPSSMDYFEIKPEDIVRVNLHTLEYGDQRMPSSEAPMHARIYLNHSDAGAIVHTHSNGMSVFAACEAGFKIGDERLSELIGDVVVADYAPAGSEDLAASVSRAFDASHACVIPHHGAVFYGPSPDVVFAIAESVEKKARNILAFDSIDSTDDLYDD